MENIIRSIVAQADINVITRRLVRIEYMKLTGTEKLSAAEKKLIKAVLEKIIAEIAQKMRHQLHSDSTVAGNMQQKVSPGKDNVIAQLLVDQKVEARPQIVSTQKFTNESLHVSEEYEQFSSPTKGVNDSFKKKSTEKSFVLTHPLCSNKELSPRQLCAKNRQSKLMTPSEALMCVLDSDAASSDNSHSDFCDTPQKNTTRDRLLNELDVKGFPLSGANDRDEKQDAKTLDIEDSNEISDSEITLIFNKKYKTQNLDLNNTCVVNVDHNLPQTNSSLSPVNGRSVHTFFKELYSKSSISYTPENSCSKSSSLDFLQMNSQKCRQDCAIDSSSDTFDFHLSDVNLVNNPDSLSDEDQFTGNVEHKKKIVHVIASSSDSEICQENCVSVAKRNQKSQLDDSVHKQMAERVLLSRTEELNSLSNEPHADALLGSEVILTHHRHTEDVLGSEVISTHHRHTEAVLGSEVISTHHGHTEAVLGSEVKSTHHRHTEAVLGSEVISTHHRHTEAVLGSEVIPTHHRHTEAVLGSEVIPTHHRHTEAVLGSEVIPTHHRHTEAVLGSEVISTHHRHTEAVLGSEVISTHHGHTEAVLESEVISTHHGHTEAMLGSEVISTHHGHTSQDIDNCVPIPIESSSCLASTSSDSSLPFSNITRAKFKIRTRKRVFDYSDSEFEHSGSPISNTSNTSQNNSSDKSPQSNMSDKSFQNNTLDKSPQNNMSDNSPQHNTSDKSQNNKSDKSPQNNMSDKSPRNNMSDKSPQNNMSDNSPQHNTSDKSQNNKSDKSPQNNKPDKYHNNMSDKSPQKNTPYKPKRNGKYSDVMIQIVDKYSYDVEVIKRGDLNDTELLEIIEKQAEEKFSSRIRKKRKSLSRSKHFESKKQRLTMLKSESCKVQDCDLDKSLETSTSSQSMEHSEDLNQTSMSTKSSVYDFSSDDVEYDMPFSSLKSHENYVSGRSASVSHYESKINKCYVAISIKEKQVSDDAQSDSHSYSSHQVGLSNSGSSNISESSQKDPLSRLKHTTGYPKNDGSDSSCSNTSDSYSCHSDSDKQASTSKGNIPQDSVSSVSVDSLSSSSHISSACSSQSETTHSMTKKSCQNKTHTNFRITCDVKKLDLENTSELTGRSTETNNNILKCKKLLEKRCVQDVEKWQILEKIQREKQQLLEEMKKLGADKITFNNLIEDIRERKINGSPFGNADDSYREHHDTIQADSHDAFSNVKDIIIIDDSDS